MRSALARVGATRLVLGLLGVLVGVYGAYLLQRGQEFVQWREALEWAIFAALAHDIVLGPFMLALGWVAGRVTPKRVVAPAAVALVVLGTTMLSIIPVLRLPPSATNPTLLDRDYYRNWWIFAAVVFVAVGLGAVLGRRRAARDRRRAQVEASGSPKDEPAD